MTEMASPIEQRLSAVADVRNFGTVDAVVPIDSSEDTRTQIFGGACLFLAALVLALIMGGAFSDGSRIRLKAVLIAVVGVPLGLWMCIDGLRAKARGALHLGLAQRGAVGVYAKGKSQLDFPYDTTDVTLDVDGDEKSDLRIKLKATRSVEIPVKTDAQFHAAEQILERFQKGPEQLDALRGIWAARHS
ncbi:MAG: hypothetical protein ACRCWS_05755 [Propionibacteriaceae bacterium]